MKWFDWLHKFSPDQIPEPVSLGVEAALPVPRCPMPLSSDDGTMADCQNKSHCMCKAVIQ